MKVLLRKCLKTAKGKFKISDDDKKIYIMQESLFLFNEGGMWMKKMACLIWK